MSPPPKWLPALLLMEECGNSWDVFRARVFSEFGRTLVEDQAKYQDCWVRCPAHTPDDDQHGTFWHCVSDGRPGERLPDLRRMERIRWIRGIIENAASSEVECWTTVRDGSTHHVLWYLEEYVVILAERVRVRDGMRYFVLKSAYVTDRLHTVAWLRKQRDAAKKKP